MDLGEQPRRVKFMIRDRGSNFTAAFDAVLAGAGIRIVLCNVRTPRMNAIAERWIASARRECLDRMLITGERHLQLVLSEYIDHYNVHRPHRALQQSPPAGRPHPPAGRKRPGSTTGLPRRPDPRVCPGRIGTGYSAPTGTPRWA